MTQEQLIPLTDVTRVNVDVESRDIDARWNERDDVAIHADGIEAFVEAGELFIASSSQRGNTKGKVEIELPLQPLTYSFKSERGDISLHDARGKLDLRLDSGNIDVKGGSGALTASNGRGDVKVETFTGDVAVNTGSGDKVIDNVTGDVNVRTGSGNTRVTGGSGGLTYASGSGDLGVTGRHLTNLTVSSASADVTIRGGSIGKSVIETASGDITCQAALTIATYEFTAASGDMVLAVPRELPARVDAATTRGSINSDLPLVAIGQRGPRSPHGKRVVGSTSDDPNRAEITLRTSSGDIRVNWSSDKPAPPPVPQRPAEPMTSDAIPIPVRAPEPPQRPDVPEDIFDDDRRRVILSALADGSLSIEEAGQLLDALGRSGETTNGAR